MKITAISVYQRGLPYVDVTYEWGRGHILSEALTSVVEIETDAGFKGYGETCPIDGNYLPDHGGGIPAAVAHLAPAILGLDPRQTHVIELAMDRRLLGHSAAKAALDIACWDILGKATDLPIYALLGGKMCDGAPMYRVIPDKAPTESDALMQKYRGQGYRQFQIKVGKDWKADIDRIHRAADLLQPGETAFADANRGWKVNEAVQLVRAVRDTNVMIEQPCFTYEECLHVRRRCDLPMKLDEVISDQTIARRLIADQACEVACLKLSNLGGLTKARRVRDMMCEAGLSVVSEDTWGGQITTAAVAHFAASTPVDHLYNSTDLCAYVTKRTGVEDPIVRNGKLFVSDAPGLGMTPDFASLSAPVFVSHAT